VKGSVVALAAFDGVVVSLLGATPLEDEDELEEELEEELLSFEGAVPDLGVSVVGGVVVVVGGGVAVLVVGGGVL
jgi:hypothetical protein